MANEADTCRKYVGCASLFRPTGPSSVLSVSIREPRYDGLLKEFSACLDRQAFPFRSPHPQTGLQGMYVRGIGGPDRGLTVLGVSVPDGAHGTAH
jgi:hypothetical protein